MGTIITAKCNCGFDTGEMYLGGGMVSHTRVNAFPNYCKDCKSLFVANMYNETIICNKCKSSNTVPYNNADVVKNLDEISFTLGEFRLSAKNSLCPECNQFSLEFVFDGMWD